MWAPQRAGHLVIIIIIIIIIINIIIIKCIYIAQIRRRKRRKCTRVHSCMVGWATVCLPQKIDDWNRSEWHFIKVLFLDCLNIKVSDCYLRRRLAREGIVTLVTLSRCVYVCMCPPSRLYHISTARRISLGGEGNALYPVLSSFRCNNQIMVAVAKRLNLPIASVFLIT